MIARTAALGAAPSISICDLAVADFAAPTCWKMLGATSVAKIAITTITTTKPQRTAVAARARAGAELSP